MIQELIAGHVGEPPPDLRLSVAVGLAATLWIVVNVLGMIRDRRRTKLDEYQMAARARLIHPPRRTLEDAMRDEQPWRHHG